MWRQTCSIFLIAASVHAENQTAPQCANTSKLDADPNRRIEVYHYYSKLRRGTTQDAAVLLIFGNGSLTVPHSPIPGITPVSLEFQASGGMTVSRFRYPRPYKSEVVPDPRRIPAVYFPIRLKLHASRTAPLGMQFLRGKLTYQLIDNKGVSPLQEIAIEIPLMIVDRHARVQREKNWPFSHIPPGEIVLMVVLCPILLPLAIACAVFMDGCG